MYKALFVFVLLTICVSMLGCGGDLQVVAADVVPTSANLIGIGATQQIQVLAKFNDGRPPENVTLQSTFKIEAPLSAPYGPADAVTINASGLLKAVDAACTWTKGGTEDDPTYGTTPYKLTVNYQNHEAEAFISVASLQDCPYPEPTNASRARIIVYTAN